MINTEHRAHQAGRSKCPFQAGLLGVQAEVKPAVAGDVSEARTEAPEEVQGKPGIPTRTFGPNVTAALIGGLNGAMVAVCPRSK